MKLNKEGVSVIIPVYNAEKYIENCIDSLFNQTFAKKMEYIFVIDKNSCDNSENLLSKKVKSNMQVHIIKPSDGSGAGYNRNIGIKLVQKTYFGFCDADDYLDRDFYEKLYDYAMTFNADVAMGATNLFSESSGKVFNSINLPFNTFYTIGSVFSSIRWNTVWDKIYKTDTYKSNEYYKFPEGVIHEDNIFLLKAVHAANKFLTVPDTFYHWRRYAGSVSSDESSQKFINDAKVVYNMLLDILEDLDIPKQEKIIVIKQTYAWGARGFVSEEEKEYLKNRILAITNCIFVVA